MAWTWQELQAVIKYPIVPVWIQPALSYSFSKQEPYSLSPLKKIMSGKLVKSVDLNLLSILLLCFYKINLNGGFT